MTIRQQKPWARNAAFALPVPFAAMTFVGCAEETLLEEEGFAFDEDEPTYVVEYERELVVVADDVEELSED